MRKFFILLVLIPFFSFSGDLQIFDTDGNDVSNKTVVLQGVNSYTFLNAYFNIKNNASVAKAVKVKRYQESLLPGSSSSFCWTNCYSPFTNVSPDHIVIGSGALLTNTFSGDYKHEGNLGWSKISYTFFDAYNSADSVMVSVIFNVSTQPESHITSYTIDTCFYNSGQPITFDAAYIDHINILGNSHFSAIWKLIYGQFEYYLTVPYQYYDTVATEISLPVRCGQDMQIFSFNADVNYLGQFVSSIDEDMVLEVFPNPVNDKLKLRSKINILEANILIYDMLGKCLIERKNENPNSFELDISHLESGIYILKIRKENVQIYNNQIIKN